MTTAFVPALYFVVPVFNEAENIATLFEAFEALNQEFASRFDLTFVLVDDGSSDDTAGSARRHATTQKLEILVHDVNRGPGAAFATGFSHLSGKLGPADWVVTMEGDNTSRHELIKRMLVRAAEGFDVVLASPYMYGGGFTQTSFLRKLLSSGANLIVKDLLSIQGILTVSSFFRLYSSESILRLQRVYGNGIVERVGFESMVEMIMKMTMLDFSISEVAMRLDSSRRKGKSKMKILRTIKGYLSLYRRKAHWQSLAAGRTKP